MKGRVGGRITEPPPQYALRIIKLQIPNLKYGIPKLKLLSFALLRFRFDEPFGFRYDSLEDCSLIFVDCASR